jgi:predicted DNA binding protein
MYSSERGEYPLHIVLEVASHEALRDLLRTIESSNVDSTTTTITPATLSEETTVTINLDTLTEKQRETLEFALTEGYYERPREVDLGTLADELDISKSAVSQRLRTAETKLITNAFEAYR